MTRPVDHFSTVWSAKLTIPERRFSGHHDHEYVPRYTIEGEGSAGSAGSAGISLESRVQILEAMIYGASISSVCNMDGSVTTNLVWGG